MALNGGGVGFPFFGIDKGFTKLLDKSVSGVNRLTEAMGDRLQDAIDHPMQTMFSFAKGMWGMFKAVPKSVRVANKWFGKLGFGITVVKQAFGSLLGPLSPLIDGIRSVVSAFDPTALADSIGQLGEITNLTSNLESEAVSTGKSAREMFAQMGFGGAQLDKLTSQATSMSMALNIGADEAAKAIRGWNEAGSELAALGFKNVEEFAKFTSAFGVQADVLRNSTLMMRNEFGLTDKEINNVIGAAVEMGKATGDVPASLNEIQDSMNRMREQARGMGVDLDGAKLANFSAQTSALAAGLFQMGQDSDTARAAASELSTALIEAEKDFHNMFAGTQDQLPEFVKELAITTGDAQSAFDLMKAGPSGFVKGMAQMVAQAKEQGTLTSKNLDFVGARMEKVLGADAAARLVGFMRTADANTIRLMGNVEKASADLGAMAKEAFRTGRTMQENYERMMMSVGDAFRKHGKQEVRDWMKNIKSAVSDANKKMAGLSDDKGPLGEFVRKLASAEHIGVQAFLPPSLQQGSIVLSHFSKQLGPVIEQMKQFGLSFSIAGIVKGAVTAVMLFATQVGLAKKEGESWGTAILRVAQTIAEELVGSIEKWGGVLHQVAEEFATFNWNDLFNGLTSTMNDTDAGPIGKIRNAFAKVFDSDLSNNLIEGWNRLWEAVDGSGLVDRVKATWNTVVNDVIKPALLSTLQFVVEEVPWDKIGKAIVSGIGTGVGESLSDMGRGMTTHFFSDDEDAMARANLELMKQDAAEHKKWKERKLAEIAALDEKIRSYGATVDEVMGETHENSVHTVVQEDMEQAIAAVEDVTKEFEALWHEAWLNVLEDFDIGTLGIAQSASGVLAQMHAIAKAKEDLMEVRGGVGAVSEDNSQRDLKIRAAVGDQAVHNPEWYRGSTGYEQLFTKKMDRLISGVDRLISNRPADGAPAPAAAARTRLAERAVQRRGGQGGIIPPSSSRSGGRVP